MSDNLRNMIQTPIIVLIMTLFATPSFQASIPNPKPTFLGTMCLNASGNYTQGSTYQNNLNTILTILESNSSSYSETSTGSGADTVYGRYYCRGDLSPDICSTCVHAATKQIISSCPNNKESITWFEQCTLLYLNSSSKATLFNLEWFPNLSVSSFKNVTDPDTFHPVLMDTMNRVINVSAYGDGFATGEGKVIPFRTLYSLAQCSWDTTGLLCEKCLRRALHDVVSCCKDSVRMLYFYPNCQLRYSTVAPFYVVRTSLENVAPTPPTSTTSVNPSAPSTAVAVSSDNLLIVVVVALTIFTFFRY